MTDIAEYDDYDATGLAELVRKGDVTPSELLEAAIQRVERRNPDVNAVVQTMYTEGRRTLDQLPDGPFKGVPFLIKDLVSAYANVPMRMGSRFMRDYVPTRHSELVQRWLRAGVVPFGKTNTPEFGIVGVTEPELFGPCRNPWDVRTSPGGSSGGSAAAVASRMVPMASGGDGGGSIRIPASCCGLFGLKPTRGRTPTGPHNGELWQGFAIEHVLTRSVRDSAAMLDATHGPDPGAPYVAPAPERPFLQEVGADPGRLRIAFSHEPFLRSNVRQDCIDAVENAVALLQDLGHEVVEARPQLDGRKLGMDFLIVLAGEVAAEIAECESIVGRGVEFKDVETETYLLYSLGQHFTAGRFSKATRDLQKMGRVVGDFFTDYDILLTPTLARPPVEIGELKLKGLQGRAYELAARVRAGSLMDRFGLLEQAAEQMFDYTPFTFLFNVSGNPAMNVPLHWNGAGVPIGVQLVGGFGQEGRLLRLASQLEEAKPWAHRKPRGLA